MLIFSGLVRKCVVADNCALLANAAFGGQFGPSNFWVVLNGTYAFAWQVYGDFSGYSDIARGSAQLLGFHLMVNFRQPFLSNRLQEFWRRWHISLSTWLRDYLYIPLGGSAHGQWKTAGISSLRWFSPASGTAQIGHSSSLVPFTESCWQGSAISFLPGPNQRSRMFLHAPLAS